MIEGMDPYEILGVGRCASLDEIRRAYRERALECHPDNHPDDATEAERQFRQLTEAFQAALRPFGPFARAGGSFRTGRTASPADFARAARGWHSAPHAEGVQWRGRPLTQRRSYARLDETRIFVWSWSLAIILGLAIALAAMGSGAVDQQDPAGAASLLLLPFGVYGVVIAATLAGLIVTRTIVWVTIRVGFRLLPTLPRPRSQRPSPSKEQTGTGAGPRRNGR